MNTTNPVGGTPVITVVPLLVLDIDGTVRQLPDGAGPVQDVANVRVFPTAVARMRDWRAKGGRIVGLTNQPGIDDGTVDRAAYGANMLEIERQTVDVYGRPLFDAVRWCPHRPEAGCWCRKPLPGLFYDLLRHLGTLYPFEAYTRQDVLLVSADPADVTLAAFLDVRFQWAADWRGELTRPNDDDTAEQAPDA